MSKYPKIKFIRNGYTKRRGAPALLEISCAQCQSLVCLYQKDGKGSLMRMYFDRIRYPDSLVDILAGVTSTAQAQNLGCPQSHQIAVPMLYTGNGENRLAYRLIPGTIAKSEIKQ